MKVVIDGHDVLIDEEDAWMLGKWTWHAIKGKVGGRYIRRSTHRPDGKRVSWLHREIIGDPVGMEVDHINGNTLDNRKENLRQCDCSENRCNCGKRENNTSGYKGVSFYKPNGMWKAQIQKNKQKYFMGYHNTPELAYEAFKAKAVELHGEFAHF